MFTGIITDIGTITKLEKRGDTRLFIDCNFDMDGVAIGASIACSGACMTVVEKGVRANGGGWFAIDMSSESINRTANSLWQEGGRLNLERAAKLGDEMGGHIVTGHVDGVGTIVNMTADGASQRLEFAVPVHIAAYLAPKGSITIDGISLTVNEVRDEAEGTVFSVNIIPHTAEETTLSDIKVGREVNLEIDILARYMKRMMEYQALS